MESTLAVKLDDVAAGVGSYLGFGRGDVFGEPAWSSRQAATVRECWHGGLRKFYYAGYDWSFLRPAFTLTILSAARTAPLPDDFGGFEGNLVVTSPSGSVLWADLRPTVPESIDRQYAAMPTTTGRPQWVAERPVKGTGSARGQRKELYVWPIPDADYTFAGRYFILPNALTDSFPYAYGGAQHAETILGACKAWAEITWDNISGGPLSQEFDRLLAQSVQLDKRNKPQLLGRNRDMSDGYAAYDGRLWPYADVPPTTYNGVVYG